MSNERIRLLSEPALQEPRLIVGFSGWMDGGGVSTGAIEYLVNELGAEPLAELDVEDCYLLNFPGSMELSAIFRPYCTIQDGEVTDLEMPTNRFYFSAAHRVILFAGREPNVQWAPYAQALLDLAGHFGVTEAVFVGSVAGTVPHTRAPRFSGSVSDERLKPTLSRFGIRLSQYEGPASITTYLTARAAKVGLPWTNLVAEVPAYVHGQNPRAVEAAVKMLAGLLELPVDVTDLRALAEALEEKVDEAIEERPELAERIAQMEEDYDNQVFDTMGDLKDWLTQQGIRLD